MSQRNFLYGLFFAAFFVSAQDKGGFNPHGTPPAPQDQKSGYRAITDGQQQIMSGALAKIPDNTSVSMKGNIIKQSGKQHYLLRDEQGTVMLHIADALWKGQEVKPDDLVAVHGTLQRTAGRLLVQVTAIQRL